MEKYEYYQEEVCTYTNLEIGGLCCLNCHHFKGIDFEEEWIKCNPYSNEIQVEKLTEENEQLKLDLFSLPKELKEVKNELEKVSSKIMKGIL